MRDILVGILKFFLAVVLLPFLAALTVSFYLELKNLNPLSQFFLWGMGTFLGVHLFVYSPVSFFNFGQKVLTEIFKFSSFLSAAVPRIIPLWAALLLTILYILTPFLKIKDFEHYIMFFVGFTVAMHIVFLAKDLYAQDTALLKPNYLLTMGISYIFNVFILALLLDLNYSQFSTNWLLKRLLEITPDIYHQLLKQVFLV